MTRILAIAVLLGAALTAPAWAQSMPHHARHAIHRMTVKRHGMSGREHSAATDNSAEELNRQELQSLSKHG